MHIVEYAFEQHGKHEWNFQKVKLNKINLLVGASGSGKTRFLNTFFNLGRIAAGSMNPPSNGMWDVTISNENDLYRWHLETEREEGEKGYVVNELLTKKRDDHWEEIVKRDKGKIFYLDEELPKIDKTQCAIKLFNENDEIEPLYDGFSKVMRRYFSGDELEKATRAEVLSPNNNLLQKNLDSIYKLELSVNLVCYYLSKNNPGIFEEVCEYFISIFPFIKRVQIKDAKEFNPGMRIGGYLPLLCVREKGVDSWIPISELSSGMQKVLLIITDIATLPKGSIYIIDEYENSLGVNAINFFPEFISENGKEIQFLISSHHPYIINMIQPENWYVFSRQGSQVSIRFGDENKEFFSKSRQQRFIQLINDPFYRMSDQ